MRVILIAGGWSNEREVSLSGARKIETALHELGHQVTFFDLSEGFERLLAEADRHDFAFINLHGAPGEDGLVQALLDKAGCPYQGSGPTASFLTLNKAASKMLFEREGIPTPAWAHLPAQPENTDLGLRYPLIVKPNSGGSSVGMSLIHTPEELPQALQTVFDLGETAMVEECVSGEELTCGILGETPLPLILIVPKDADFFDYQNKYDADGAEEICPAPVDGELVKAIQAQTLGAHRALGLYGYSRGDFMVRDGKPYLLEINTLPGMTPTSLMPRAASVAGFSFNQLIEELIRLGRARPGAASS